jgi:hypothetical protein
MTGRVRFSKEKAMTLCCEVLMGWLDACGYAGAADSLAQWLSEEEV